MLTSLRFQRFVAREGLEILGLLAEVPDAAVLGRNIPVICGLMDQTVLKHLIPEHDTGYARDQFRLVPTSTMSTCVALRYSQCSPTPRGK